VKSDLSALYLCKTTAVFIPFTKKKIYYIMFDIEPVSLVISLVLIILFSLPIVLYKRKQSQNIKSQELFLEQIKSESNLQFAESDKWRDLYFIGLDPVKNILVYIKFGSENTIHKIDLSKSTELQLVKNERTATIQGKPVNVIDGLYLKINNKEEKGGERVLEFYDSELFSDNLGELPLIQKWEKTLKPIVKYNQSQLRKNVLV
jgi:hypothetical protein